ncbi:oxidoreductase [uncultured Amnibacterium sp.]|uniref:oxidoreductase n=1 Tax=uncultured Amnibacterium sp. TaxID=1631851 RepID=UPI0035CB9740
MVSPESLRLPDQSGRVVVVTGANSGLGFEAGKRLAAAGAHVVLACRDLGRGEEAARRMPGSTEVQLLDTSDLASVRSFPDRAPERIDVLIDNAGVMATDEARTAEGFELQLATNFLGHFALTALLLPRLTDRVVLLSSLAHWGGRIVLDDLNRTRRRYSRWAAYADSKLADLMFAFDLQARFAATGSPLRAMAAHPGMAGTNLTRDLHVPAAVSGVSEAMLKGVGQSAAAGALPTLLAATAKDLPGGSFVGPSGLAELRGTPIVASSSRTARNRELQILLTAEAERLTGVELLVPA